MTVLAAVDPSSVGAGPFGLLIVLLMGVATVFLIRNMTGRLKRLPPEFPPSDEQPRRQGPDVPPDPLV
ncbi:MAG: hypothetical protein JWN88_278 [Frankiales bacterium]|jgi:hypothetical protein|nr:hypothetical protein [Frankiales bacterium]